MLLSLSHMWWSQPGVRQQEKMPLPQDISPASPLHTTLFLLVTMVRKIQRWDLSLEGRYS